VTTREAQARRRRLLAASGFGALAVATVALLVFVALGRNAGNDGHIASPGGSASTPAGRRGGSRPSAPGPRLFAPDSVWNAPLRDTAPLDPSSAVLVETLRDTVAQNIADRSGPWISTAGTSPLYTVPVNQPTVRVQLDPGSWKVGLQQTFLAVPIPADAKPAAGTDAHMTVWQPSTGRLWEFFKARKLADGWHANFGGSMQKVTSSPGYYTTDAWPGLSQTWWGATATSLPVIAGTMMIKELKAGVISHALAMNIPWARPNVYSWPAQRTDGKSTDPNAIPEGARFRLDPQLDIDKLNLPPMTRMMAKAAQRYGIIVRDQTGHAISFFAENPAQYGTNPYTGSTGFYRGSYPNPVTEAFPWQYLQLLKMDPGPTRSKARPARRHPRVADLRAGSSAPVAAEARLAHRRHRKRSGWGT
jgi:hypothetical protein